MRRQPTEIRSQGTRVRTRDESRGAMAKRSRIRRLALEGLEARTLLATNPLPGVVTGQVAASANLSGTSHNESSPFIAVNPLDSSKLVTAFTDRDTSSGTTLFISRVTYSADGGLTWTSLNPTEGLPTTDPTSTTGAKLRDTTEGVGFDRNGNFYVGILETNGGNAGDILVDKYNFSSSTPIQSASTTVYSWNQSLTNASAQPTVLNFSMAVDGNVNAYTDPQTNVVQSDPSFGSVYIAWTLNVPPPQNPPNPYNPFRIQLVASPDGTTWSGGGAVNTLPSGGSIQTLGNPGGGGNQRYTDPQVTVSQGKGGGTDGGRVSVIWDDYGTGSADGTNVDTIYYAGLSFAKGTSTLTAVTNARGTSITTTNVRGAQTGSAFPLSTPSSPLGIGPGAVVAVDNTLGSYDLASATFTNLQGRIYVSYVNRTIGAPNPADNTNIYLRSSADDGLTWSAPTQVNDDNGQVDGHTSGDFNIQGRPQYEPAIAVDNTSGTLVMTWLDVRDDASLGRYASYLTTSIDGGSSFAPQTFVDRPNLVTNAITGTKFVAGPYSGNESGGNQFAETSTAFGLNQGLAVSGGVVHPAWATTVQNGISRASSNLTIDTAQVSIPSGPRIISGTSGPVGAAGFQTFVIVFDRPVSVASFTAGAVQVQYLNALTGQVSSLGVSSVTAINSVGVGGREATRFTVTLTQLQIGVGTYSYSVSGTNIQGLIRTPTSDGNGMDQNPSLDTILNGSKTRVGNFFANPSPQAPINGTPFSGPYDATTLPIIVGGPKIASTFVGAPISSGSTTASTIAVTGAPTGSTVSSVTVSGVSLSYPNVADLQFVLTAPDGAKTTLVPQGGLTGSGLTNATLATTSALAGAAINGLWTLSIVDAVTGTSVGSLTKWSLTIVPTPALPTGASIVYGAPSMIGVTDPIGSAQTGLNLVLNSTVGAIDVTFNQAMDPATFTATQVLAITGPTGPLAGPFTVKPDPQPGENASFPKTFQVRFPAQQLSGTYNILLGAGIKGQNGAAVDVNQNAGVSLLFTNQTGTIPAGPSTFTSTQTATIDPGTPASPSSVSTSITVPATSTSLIQNLALSLDITYPNDPDLTAVLTTPIIDPTTNKPYTVLLFSGNGSASGSQSDFSNTVFDDQATTPIANGAPPFFGRFKPLQSFLVNGHLAGASGAGTYTLTIFNAGSGTGTLNGFSITVTPQTTTNTGLGEPVADRSAASFRIFTMDPTNPLSSNTWTPVGPASNNNQGNSGRVSAIAVDASDPSGNTVYVAGASGGVWKTNNFLTTNSLGPTYNLLTGASAGNALNIGSIAIFSRNNDPGQSIVIAGTGEGNTAQPGVQGSSTVGTSAGIGFLISYNGGKTWTLNDSLANYDAQGNEISFAKRDHTFIGTATYKVVVDPHVEPDGNIIIYAALGGGASGAGGGGLYRSVDSGKTWALMRSGYATDVVLDPNSGPVNAISNPTGNLQTLYAAFLGQGVFLSPNQGNTFNPMTGGVGDPLILDVPLQGKPAPVPVGAPPLTPTSGGGRIVLAKPSLTGNDLLDAEYETWLYAAVVTPDGHFSGLFLTKDNGANWTDVRLPNALAATATAAQGLDPSNNTGLGNYDIAGGQGNYDIALAVDPTNPNITYIGGSADFGPTTMIRVDVTRLADPYSLYASTETPDGHTLPFTTSPISVPAANLANFSGMLQLAGNDPLSNPYTNLYRNPVNVFTSNSTVFVFDTASFSNDGSGAWWTPFDGFIGGTDVHIITTITDPVTGKARLLVGYDQGVASGIDNNGTLLTAIGNQRLQAGVANGNLQITQFYNGAAQPGALAAQVASALFYGMGQDDGFPVSTDNVDAYLNSGAVNPNYGNIEWFGSTGDGTDVATDQTGTGVAYRSVWPCCNTIGPNEFFQVSQSGGSYNGRTFGLLQSTSVPPGNSLPGTSDPQWPYGPSSNFAVNPVANNDMVIASRVGRLFGTINQGVIWTELAEPSVFDSTTIPALAYGAPAPSSTGGAVGNYILVGTAGGHIYVTFNGGGNGSAGTNNWIPISAGLKDAAPIQRIVTDPTRGTHDAYAISSDAVYYNADTSAVNSTWVNVTGDLFQQTVNPFGDANQARQQLLNLGGLVADWRYTIPFSETDPTQGVHPMLYVAGVGGVFRSTDNGTTWTIFPDQTLATPVVGGDLPTATISDLDLVLGNVDPTTGHPNVSTGPNLLLATTYGSGSYGIRLAPIIFNDATNSVTESQDSKGVLSFQGLSEQSAFGTAVAVTVEDVTDPAHPIFLGGYNPAEGLPTISASFKVPANQTNALGKFGISGSYPTAPANNPFLYDGARQIALFATDASGTKGNVVSFQITNNLPTPSTAPALVNATPPPAPLTSGLVVGGVDVTTSTRPTFFVTLPGTGVTAIVSLIRIDSSGNKVTANQATITGSGTIQDPGPVAKGAYTYEFQYTVTINGQPTASPLSPGTTVRIVDPPTIALFPQDDSGTPGDFITNVKQPRFIGTAVTNPTNDPAVRLQLVATAVPAGSGLSPGAILATSSDPSSGQYLLQPSSPLPDGAYSIALVIVDAAGDKITSSAQTLTISTSGPKVVPSLALVPSSVVPPNNPNVTVVRRPSVYGVTDPGATVGIYGIIGGGPLTLLAIATAQQFANGGHPAGYYQAQLPSNLGDGQVTLYAFARNSAGNGNPTPGVLTVKITSAFGDYTGVGRAGLAVYSPGSGTFTISRPASVVDPSRPAQSNVTIPNFGLANVDIAVPGDYNGDGQTDPAIYRPTNGYWAIYENSQANSAGSGAVVVLAPIVPIDAKDIYGQPINTFVPMPAEYDVDGQSARAIFFVNSRGAAYFIVEHNQIIPGTNFSVETIAWGLGGDTPVPSDYDGSGKAQIAVYRQNTGAWYIRGSGLGGGATTPAGSQEPAIFVTAFKAGDVPDQGDYDGINRAEPAIFRPSTETFYIYNPITRVTRPVVMPKLAGQVQTDVIIPASADFSGDGKYDAAIFDQTRGIFEYIDSKTGAVVTQSFFASGRDIPLTAPESYRAAVNSLAAAVKSSSISPFLPGGAATVPASPSGASAAVGSSQKAAAAVVVGAPIPTGSTSTGKASTLPTGTALKAAPLVLASSTSRPAQTAADSAIESLGKSYNGLFF